MLPSFSQVHFYYFMHRKSRFWVVSTGWLLIAVGCAKVDDVELTPGPEALLRIEAELTADGRPYGTPEPEGNPRYTAR